MVIKVFCFVIIFTLSNAACPTKSISWQNWCFVFQSDSVAFPYAEFECAKMNGNLVSIHDGFTNALLTSSGINFTQDSTVSDFWIGLNKFSGNWSWTDNSTIDFTDWEPSDAKIQTCVALNLQNGYWNSEDCHKTKPYVCEVSPDVVPSHPAYLNCSYGWIYFEPTNSCYGNDNGLLYNNWTSAEQYCFNIGAHLPSLHSYEETKFLSIFYDVLLYAYWTGLYYNNNELSWKWSDGSNVDYLPWKSGRPYQNISCCAELGDEVIINDFCTNTKKFICKKAAPVFLGSKCPSGGIEWQNSCYIFQSNLFTFSNARFSCNSLNGTLTSVHNGFNNALLAAHSSQTFNQSTDFWIGLTTLKAPEKWSWMDDSAFDYQNWAPSEPKNQSMNCASVTSQNGFWKSDDCSETKPFVCEVPIYPAYVNCSHGWHYFEPTHSCYGKDSLQLGFSNWTYAEEYCITLEAHLPSLHSFEEAKFLSFVGQHGGLNFWIGLYYNNNENSWKWSDGSPIDYLPWGYSYPFNDSKCAVLYNETLVACPCNNSNSFLIFCKKAAPEKLQLQTTVF